MIKVVIEMDDNGALTVGQEPEGQPEGAEDPNAPQGGEGGEPQMQPAKSIDQALTIARSLLEGASPDDSGSGSPFDIGMKKALGGGGMNMKQVPNVNIGMPSGASA